MQLFRVCCLALVTCSTGPALAADETLKLHVAFNETVPSPKYADVSGNGNDAWQFNPTNNIDMVPGVFGTMAGEFTYAGFTQTDGYHIYPAGQYLGITNLNGIRYLTNATISFWAQFSTSGDTSMQLLSAGYSAPYARGGVSAATNGWFIGRDSASYLSFVLYLSDRKRKVVSWPNDTVQTSPGKYSTTAMHLYTVTIDCVANQAIAYYDGRPWQTNQLNVPWIRVYGFPKPWIAVGTATMDGTPEWGDDKYPNSGYFVGKMDELRMYNRALSASEIWAVYDDQSAVMVTVDATDSSAGEPGTGEGGGSFTFTRTGPTSQSLTVSFLVSGTATSGSDYAALPATVRFAAGSSTVSVPVVVLDDAEFEFDETLTVTVTPGAGYVPGPTTATIIIGDDESIIVDDTAATYFGTWSSSTGVPGYYGAAYRHDQNTDKGTKSARFTPSIPTRGSYDVYIWYSADSNRPDAVPVDIVCANGTNTVLVNQQLNGGMWNSLGNFVFHSGTSGYVRIRTTETSGFVIADAVKLVPRERVNALVVAGKIRYYASGEPISDIQVEVSGGTNVVISTTPEGSFSAWLNPGSDYDITPTAFEDTPTANGVTTLDISLIRRHILGLANLDSPFKLLAADVNGSRGVTTADISLIRRVILGVTNIFPAGLWRFVRSDHIFDPVSPWDAPTNIWQTDLATDVTGRDFVAVKLGDVNNSWAPPTATTLAATSPLVRKPFRPPGSGDMEVRFGDYTAVPGQRITCYVKVGGFAAATTLQFTLRWNPTVLRFLTVGNFATPSLTTANFGTDYASAGMLTLSWDEPEARGLTLPDGTAVFTVGFEVIGPPGSVSGLSLANAPTPLEASASLMPAELTVHAGKVLVMEDIPLVVTKAPTSGNQFNLSVRTERDASYVLEYSDSLRDWVVLTTFLGDGGVRVFSDSAEKGQRFYRVLKQ